MSTAENDLYQEVVLEHKRAPRNFGQLAHPTHQAQGTNPSCGDRVSVQLQMDGQRVADIRFQALKREYVYNGEHPLAFNPEGEGWCHALTIDRLHREGLQGSYWGYGASRLDLAGELAALLWAELNLECGTIPAVTEQSIVIARLFETWAHQREGRLLHHLGDLKRHLSREIEAWH